MAIELVAKYCDKVDEIFTHESKKSLLTNKDYSFSGAHTIKIYKISTSSMNDYDRANTSGNWSRYGKVLGLDATTEEFTMKKDRSFTFIIDTLDADETGQQLAAASALARQVREVVIPEVDKYTYGIMCAEAGIKPSAVSLTKTNIYEEIVKANEALDNSEVPETGRILLVTPSTYTLMKQCSDITMESDIGNDLRLKGVISNLDGCNVIKVPETKLPSNFGFMIAHPIATVAPIKLEDYRIHVNPPGYSGSLVEGRICYDAFILENKKNAIYYQEKIAE